MRLSRPSSRILGLLVLCGLIAFVLSRSDHARAGVALLRLEGLYEEFDLRSLPEEPVVAAFIAHADDECFLMAGTLVRLVRERNAKVYLVSASPDRRECLERSAEVLGLHDVLVMQDLGDASKADLSVLDDAVAAVLEQLEPDVVLGFGPEGITGHPDHQALGMSVWRVALRRGSGTLMRAVMPREFAPLVSKYGPAPEPGWGIGPVLRVPLGNAGELRSRSADAYIDSGEREVLARDEWKANLANTEFFEVTVLDGPANAPPLFDSAEAATMEADEILFAVHPSASWDLRGVCRAAMDGVVQRLAGEGASVALLINEDYPFSYLETRDIGQAFVSAGGEHRLRPRSSRLWFVGGSYGSCLERGIHCAVAGAIDEGVTDLELVLVPPAIYSIVFEDDSIGAVSLAQRMNDSADDGRELLLAIFERWMAGGASLPGEGSLPDLTRRLSGWSIELEFNHQAPEVWRTGSGAGVLRLRTSEL